MKFNFDFYGSAKRFFTIAIVICVLGFACNFIPFFGPTMDIQFRGGAIATYSYTGDIDENDIEKAVEDIDGMDNNVSIQLKKDLANNLQSFDVTFDGDRDISPEEEELIEKALTEAFAESNIKLLQLISVSPQMGRDFLIKCLIAILLASAFMLVYVGIRFRKIGGVLAGATSLLALLHDTFIAYTVFVICDFTINDNFIAVVLTILGYGLNDTVVIFDRVRENRRILGPKTDMKTLLNTSVNQSLSRTTLVSLATISAIGIVCIVALVANISSILTFAFPMMIALLASVFSTNCITLPLWALLQEKRDAKLAAAKSKR